MYDLTTTINKVLQHSTAIAYDVKPLVSVIKFYNISVALEARTMKRVIERLDFELGDKYLVVPRNGTVYIYTWANDEEHFNALKDKYAIHLEKLLEVQHSRIELMEEALPLLEEMAALKPKLDTSVITLTKILKDY